MSQDSRDGSNVYQNVLPLYFGSLAKMPQFNDFKTADELLESITGFQKRFGSKVSQVRKNYI
jgi:hypothetical protein